MRRAYERQEPFTCDQVESVANNAAFVSPAALVLTRSNMSHHSPDWKSAPDAMAAFAEGPFPENSVQFPLSSLQESIWFQEQHFPGLGLYNLPVAWRVSGELDARLLALALQAIAERHETLRTVFCDFQGRPVQVVRPDVPFSLQVSDFSAAADGLREIEQALATEAARPFDLHSGPLARAHLYRLSPRDHVLLVNLHHLIADEWSLNVFLRELQAHYTAAQAGQASSLGELPIQYGDYAVWQRELLNGTLLGPQIEYWRTRLGKPLPNLLLPADRPRPARPSFQGATLFSELSPGLSSQLKQLARSHGVTLFMLLLAAFKTLLWRYTRRGDLIVGSPLAGRERVETEDLIGLFANLVALRTELAEGATFLEVLDGVRQTVLGACANQEVTLGKVLELVHPVREPGRHPLFEVVFGLQPSSPQGLNFPDLHLERIELHNGGSKFDWSLLLTDTPRGLGIRCEYRTELFDRSTMATRLQHFETLLMGIVEQPSSRLSKLPLLTEVERLRFLPPNRDAVPQARGFECLHDWFERQAASTPTAPAVTFGGESLTYAELNARASALAIRLSHLGVGPEIRVALYLDRSFEMLIGILGVLKAGGAYVPIDPGCPAERLAFILKDSTAHAVLTQSRRRGELPRLDVPVVCLDEQLPEDSPLPSDAFLSGVRPSNAAYVIYTSGSTGQPKGVIVTHQNVARLFSQTEHWFRFSSADVWTLFHSYAFDFSVWEIWGALLYGGRLVIVPFLTSRSPGEFYQLLADEKVTVLNQTPSAFGQLITAEQGLAVAPPLRLRYVICGGEALELQSLQPWFARHPDHFPQVVNMYGITETTVHVTYRPIRQADLEKGMGSVLGVSIPDLQVYLLDENLQPVPTGVPGEICVSGEGLARGYLNRPELTQQRFVPSPFSAQGESRLYRSGDLGRYTAQGELEYLGRLDHQVKIRGFRIELGEVEAALNRHPEIRQSVVLAEQGAGGCSRLVAYFVPGRQRPSPGEVRDFLRSRLPEYMIPALFIPLDTLPLTVNGKIDRRALPAPAPGGEACGRAAAPTPLEKLIADAWSETLGVPSPCPEDDFFCLGGHSLLATQAMSRIASALGLELSVGLLFEAPTIALLAQKIDQIRQERPAPLATISRRPAAAQNAELLARLDQLTGTELDELLSQSSEPLSK